MKKIKLDTEGYILRLHGCSIHSESDISGVNTISIEGVIKQVTFRESIVSVGFGENFNLGNEYEFVDDPSLYIYIDEDLKRFYIYSEDLTALEELVNEGQ